MSATPELIVVWVAVIAYAVSTGAFAASIVLGRERVERLAVTAAALGALAQGVGIALRWARTGHGPVMGFVELAPLAAFFAMAGFLVLVWRHRGLAIGGIGLAPVALLIVGASLLADRSVKAIGPTLTSLWLVIHVVFANIAFGLYSAAFVLAVAFLIKDAGGSSRLIALFSRFPEPDVLDSLVYRTVGAGFVFQTVMLVSGSIWANEAWGRYWGWDAIETWSLIAWVTYAIYLHLMLTMGWRGCRSAWVAVVAMAVILFSLVGVPLVYHSIHGAYLSL